MFKDFARPERKQNKSVIFALKREFVTTERERTEKRIVSRGTPKSAFWPAPGSAPIWITKRPRAPKELSLLGFAATRGGRQPTTANQAESQKLWLGPGCVALSSRWAAERAREPHPSNQTWQRGSQPLNCESGSVSALLKPRLRCSPTQPPPPLR